MRGPSPTPSSAKPWSPWPRSWLARVGKGDKVAILLPNSAEFAAAFYASALLGAVSVPINNLCKEDEIRFYVTDRGRVCF
ncbi:MAG: AMP-binding protein [Thermodesulfobacteriota bacterium]